MKISIRSLEEKKIKKDGLRRDLDTWVVLKRMLKIIEVDKTCDELMIFIKV